MSKPALSRRAVIGAWLALPAAAALARTRAALAQGGALPLTPPCGAGPTPAQTEGPFFTPGTPEKRNFRADVAAGEPFALAGLVLDSVCRPVPGALVELWHADAEGRYDNRGYRLRGHQRADAAGRFGFATIRPGRYTGRTRHFHVKVQAPGGPLLTTQLYFPGEPGNARDGLFDPTLVMAVSGASGRFDFVVATA